MCVCSNTYSICFGFQEDGRKKRKRLTKAEMREKAIQEEERLRATEQMLLNFEKGPQSVDDFDRLVLSSPDSSLCWIKYMAFHLQVDLNVSSKFNC